MDRDLEFWRCLHLLREHRRVAGDGDGGHLIRGRGVRPRIKTNAEVKVELRRALEVFSARERRERLP